MFRRNWRSCSSAAISLPCSSDANRMIVRNNISYKLGEILQAQRKATADKQRSWPLHLSLKAATYGLFLFVCTLRQ